jgi:hypothetical protein
MGEEELVVNWTGLLDWSLKGRGPIIIQPFSSKTLKSLYLEPSV